MDTIFALASARGKAGVAIVRVSGPHAFEIARHLSGRTPVHRQSILANLRDDDGLVIDQALILGFESDHSFTGEETVEFHLHGSMAVTNRVLTLLAREPGTRLADPGEFTRRALENGCLDLAQVEGLADLIEAETEAQRRQAMRVFDGALGDLVEAWRSKLIRAAALVEATIDFADEEVPVDVRPEVESLVSEVIDALSKEAASVQYAERLRDGFEVAIVGPPNIGKSTLLNALAGREAAITSDVAGTTRDVIEVSMDLKGLPVSFLDTAGLRDTSDHVEAIGVSRARDRAERADLRIILVADEAEKPDIDVRRDDLVVVGKSDLRDGGGVSGLTGEGIDDMISKIVSVLWERSRLSSVATRDRHRVSMLDAIEALKSARIALERGLEMPEIVSEDLRSAIRSLETLIGRVDVEAILGEIFASFCLGK
ncbi:MAG: tRNA uridine-5-carboxymethylaminomethyl(34) synthesis GTPase MnmE [Pseudomonadota bacterium]